MKNMTLLLLGGLVFLASCSTGNMASFSKRKYTKGKYKPEKNDYKVAQNKNTSEDTKYVVKTEKNENKQSYKINKSKVKKEETVAQKATPVQTEVKTVETEEVYVAENNTNTIVTDGITENKPVREETPVVKNVEEAATPASTPKPAGVGEILGYIGFAFGLIAFLLAVLGWLTLGLAYGALAMGIIGLGLSIASWVIDGQSIWNLWGVISSAVAIALSVVFMILWFIIF